MVGLKLAIIGSSSSSRVLREAENWVPFGPNVPRHLERRAIIFFAYIGFDAVSTAAEETKNPQRDMPSRMIASLVICTIVYILVAMVLTGL